GRRASAPRAQLERMLKRSKRGFVIGGRPAPAGKTADLVYRSPQAGDLLRLVEEDPYWTGGVWKAWHPTDFAQFLEPWKLPPVVTDGSRAVIIVEGEAPDVEMASFA